MANYTLELRELLENNVNIFDFDYPIFSESYRKTFEENFINYFYYREIGVETVARFKHNLKTQLNIIMPFYNKMYLSQNLEQRILDNYDVTETFERDVTGKKIGNNDTNYKQLFSDTGRKRVDINNVDYVTNISKEINNSNSNVNEENKEKWTRRMQGNIGVQTDADAIIKYESSLKNIDLMVFEELDSLFMQVF